MKVKLRCRLLAPLAFVFAVAGCERGCRATGGSDAPIRGGAAPRGSSPSLDLGGTDCSDGLARCVDGQIQVSVVAHVPHPCGAGEKGARGCECPWRPATASPCPQGCAKDGLEVVAEESIAREQLCAAPPAAPATRPMLATELTTVTICAAEAITCEQGIVTVCAARGQPARRVAACVDGCAPGVALDPGVDVTSDGVASILCRRAHAERR